MGCQPIKCSVCGGSFAACQMKNGKCAICRAKEEKEQNIQVKIPQEKKHVIVP